jgi:FkbM family methyltransferase
MKYCHYLFTALFIINNFTITADNIVINKKNVKHSFVPFDTNTDHFVKNIFSDWENETFEIFDQVKDSDGIAIDLGSWIGTTAIWLSKNFNHVIAVDADQVSLQCLKNNLQASECTNVTICQRPVSQTSKQFIFGPRGNTLNESISYIKDLSNNTNDYFVQGITFKQLIHDFVYMNDALPNKKISFIKCDIEGGEETILEDILYFAYYNKVKVYMSFHYDWWKNKNIKKFEYLFKFFNTNCSNQNITEHIQQNPFCSILFDPLEATQNLIKSNIPVVIIGYNQLSYIKNMVSQLEKYTSDIIIVDNNSSYEPLLNYYANDFKYTLLRQKQNHGYTVVYSEFVQNLLGNIYIMTDPDLQFNSKLPDNFIESLLHVSNYFKAYKVGFALFIESDDLRTDIFYQGKSIKEWEAPSWQKDLYYPMNPNLLLYDVGIDTTFCLVNKTYPNNLNIRVAGDFTCLHLPWFKNFKDFLTEGEYEFYLQNNISTSWFK